MQLGVADEYNSLTKRNKAAMVIDTERESLENGRSNTTADQIPNKVTAGLCQTKALRYHSHVRELAFLR